MMKPCNNLRVGYGAPLVATRDGVALAMQMAWQAVIGAADQAALHLAYAVFDELLDAKNAIPK